MGVEYSDGEFVGAQVLPDVFHGVEFRCIGRQLQERDVIRPPWLFCVMPSRSIHDQQGMRVGGHGFGDLCEVQFHRFGIDAWQDQPCGYSASRTGRPEDIVPFVARIARGARAYPALCPDAGQRPLLTNPCLVLEPYLQRISLRPVWQDFRNQSGKAFLKAAWVCGSALGCSGCTDSRRKPGLAR